MLHLTPGSTVLPRFVSPRALKGSLLLALILILAATPTFARAEASISPRYFSNTVRPLLKQYCFPCHSSEKHKGDFDMERFALLAEVKRQPKIW